MCRRMSLLDILVSFPCDEHAEAELPGQTVLVLFPAEPACCVPRGLEDTGTLRAASSRARAASRLCADGHADGPRRPLTMVGICSPLTIGVNTFPRTFWPFLCLLWKMTIQAFCPFSIELFFKTELWEFPRYSADDTLVRRVSSQCSTHPAGCLSPPPATPEPRPATCSVPGRDPAFSRSASPTDRSPRCPLPPPTRRACCEAGDFHTRFCSLLFPQRPGKACNAVSHAC